MNEEIYSDLWAEVLVSEAGDKRVYIHQKGTIYSKSLILPNLLAAKRLIDYLYKLCSKNKDYFKRVGEPLPKLNQKSNRK